MTHFTLQMLYKSLLNDKISGFLITSLQIPSCVNS